MSDSESDSSNSDNGSENTTSVINIAQLATNLDSDSESDGDQRSTECKPTMCMFSLDTEKTGDPTKSPKKVSLIDGPSDESSDDDEYSVLKKPQMKRFAFSTKLDNGINFKEVYTNSKGSRSGKEALSTELSTKRQNELMKSSVLTPDVEQKHTLPPYQEGLNAMRKKRQKEKANSKGKNWFDMKAPEMTEEQKNDLKVLQMRHVLDPKAFYKRNDFKTLPKFFQMGKVVENAADFYNGRIPKKQRKQTLVDELLADAKFRQYNKRKYTEAVHSKSIPRGKIKMAKRLKKRRR